MTTVVRIRPLAADGAAGGTLDSTVSIRLVDARGRVMIGLRTLDGAPVTAYLTHRIPAAGPAWEIGLTPQSVIARADAAATYYAVTISAPHRSEYWRIQVPDADAVQELIDLVGAAAIAPGSLAAARLLPLGATDGQVAVYDADTQAWVAGTVSGTSDVIDGGSPSDAGAGAIDGGAP